MPDRTAAIPLPPLTWPFKIYMPHGKTWREIYAPEISAIIKENEGKSVKELKKILSDANPGQYGHMRKTWANEYMIQLGLSKRKVKRTPDTQNPDQLNLL